MRESSASSSARWIRGPASRTASLISVKSPFDILSNETLHQFILMGLQIASQGLDDQIVDIWKPSRLYLLLDFPKVVIPLTRMKGLSEEQIHAITVDNPARVLSIV